MTKSGLALVGVVAVTAVAGCSSSAPGPSGAASAASAATSATSNTPSTTTSSTTSTPTRAPQQLQSALLGAADIPAGWTVYQGATTTATATATSAATSSDPACAGFLKLVADPPNPLPANQAHVEVDGGNLRPPFVSETIEAYPDAAAAAAALKAQQQSVAACSSVTYSVEGKTSPVAVSIENPPSLPVPAFGIRLTASTGGLQGYDARIVNAQAGDTVISLTFLSATPEQLNSLSTAAVTKAAGVLKAG